jgi:hypothetical protein
MNALRVSPRQLFEASRLADRTGSAFMQELAGGRLLVLLSTGGQSQPDLALELDRDGNIVARQFLDLAHQEPDDGFADFGEEEPLPPPVDVSQARPAPLCECPDPFADDGFCARCGRTLATGAQGVPEAA